MWSQLQSELDGYRPFWMLPFEASTPPVFRYAPALRELLAVLPPSSPCLKLLSDDNVGSDHRSTVIHEEVVVVSHVLCEQPLWDKVGSADSKDQKL